MNPLPSIGEHLRGQRWLTPVHLAASRLSERADGLPDGVQRYALLGAVKRARHTLGLSDRHVVHLEYLIGLTRERDWQPGETPIVYQSVATTARDRGCTTRSVRNIERELADLGLLAWKDSANHRRFGVRDADGRLAEAYGVDLAPLAARYGEIRAAADAADAERRAWPVERRRWMACRADMRRLQAALGVTGTAPPDDLDETATAAQFAERSAALEAQRAEFAEAYCQRAGLDAPGAAPVGGPVDSQAVETPADAADPPDAPSGTTGIFPQAGTIFPHIQYKTTPTEKQTHVTAPARGEGRDRPAGPPAAAPADGAEDRDRKTPDTGIQHVTLDRVLRIAPDRLRQLLPWDRPATWRDLIAAASVLRHEMGASPALWIDGERLIGSGSHVGGRHRRLDPEPRSRRRRQKPRRLPARHVAPRRPGPAAPAPERVRPVAQRRGRAPVTAAPRPSTARQDLPSEVVHPGRRQLERHVEVVAARDRRSPTRMLAIAEATSAVSRAEVNPARRCSAASAIRRVACSAMRFRSSSASVPISSISFVSSPSRRDRLRASLSRSARRSLVNAPPGPRLTRSMSLRASARTRVRSASTVSRSAAAAFDLRSSSRRRSTSAAAMADLPEDAHTRLRTSSTTSRRRIR